MSPKQEAFPFIPAWLDELELSPATFRVYAHLCRRGDNRTRIAWPSIDSMSKACRISRKTVCRALGELVEDGLIRKHGKPFGGSTRYLILTPNIVTTDTNGEEPIAPPRADNRAPHGPPIESPGTREGHPEKVIQGSEERGQSPPPHSLILKINSVSSVWTLPKLSAKEAATVETNRALLDSIPADDWQTLRTFYAARLPDGSGYYRPVTRERFIRDIEDIHAHAMNWRSKQPKPTSKPKPSTAREPEETPMTPEEIKEFLSQVPGSTRSA